MATKAFKLPEIIDHRNMDPPPNYYEIDSQKGQIEQKLYNLDDKFRSTVIELEDVRQDLHKMTAFNKTLEKKIEEADTDRKSIQSKIDSLIAKLGVSSSNVNRCNDEKESLRTKLNDSQVLVARLEERLSAASSELDRMRDPANPESNMCIKKHVINDKKEIKKLRVEVANEKTNLETDIETSHVKEVEIKTLEKELANVKQQLEVCGEERSDAQAEEEEERRKKIEIVDSYQLLKVERTTFEQRLKDARIQLGVKLAGKNVNVKMVGEMKSHEKEMQKQLNSFEKRLKDTMADLDILRNRHKMSKTAMAINNHTRRTQYKTGDTSSISLANSGTGNVSFSSKVQKGKSQGTSDNKLSESDRNSERSKGKQPGSMTDRPKGGKGASQAVQTGSLSDRPRAAVAGSQRDTQREGARRQESLGKGNKRASVQFVPQPKAKLTANAR